MMLAGVDQDAARDEEDDQDRDDDESADSADAKFSLSMCARMDACAQ